ncbi:ATP-binding protein [Burkholderia ubonensis]|nr:ATP-binding protein [Burkholderia ubonensis]RQP37311.1 ATP-binding protein [Burkholderia ubonensis]RQP40919.1 ATP-binding protein [Burkholderia ubonensis]RQP52736.1 ATP-binding protein [Burkholderia ubonensis]RQP54315.1 ATP-binding protein [Burkholderia ubonensis]
MDCKPIPEKAQKVLTKNPELLWVDAIYLARDEDQGVDNPLIRALPRFVNEESVLAAFRNVPTFNPVDRELSASARIHRVGTLNLYIETLPCHPGLIESVFRVITQGYAWRNPLVNIQGLVRKHYSISMTGDGLVPIVPPKPSHAAGLALFGVSGVGKTTSLNRTLSFLPPVIRHKTLTGSGLQVVWLKVDCPPDGSVNQLFHWILLEYDRLLGTSYAVEVGRNARLDRLINKVAAVAKYHHTGIIVIDEVQFAVNGAAKRGDALMDFFVTFSNVVGVPLLLAGTPKALSLFEKSFRLARRTGDHGAIIYTNMAFDAEWEYFLTGLFKFQWIREPAVLDEKFSKALYDATQGIHSLVIRLFQLAQITAIRDGSEKMTVSLLRQLARDRFGPVQPMIAALRSKKKKRIELYDDLLVETLAGLDEEVKKNTRGAQVQQATEQRQTNAAQLAAVSSLVSMNVPQSLALKAVLDALSEEPGLTGFGLVKAALLRTEITPAPPKPDLPEQSSLNDIVRGAASPEEAIKALRQAGVLA